MKILIIIDSLGSGGAERSTAVMADYLAEKNIAFTILCLEKKEIGVQQQLQEKAYDIKFIQSVGFYKQTREIATVIKKGKFCVVHSILFRSNLRTRFAKLFTRFIHLESLVNTTYSSARFNDKRVNAKVLSVYKKIDQITAKKFVDHFHSITHTVKDHYIEELGLDKKKFSVIYRGRQALLQDYTPELINKTPRLINVGRHEFQKGQLYLLEATKLLKEKGYRFTLDIYGREGKVTPELKSYIKQHKLEGLVNLRGFSHEVPKELLRSDIFVFPSLYEGLGGALIEAQSAALPIACNDIPVLREVVNENKNARLFDVENVESMVAAISYFLNDPNKQIEYGQKSLQNFKEKFLETENNERMLKLYKLLC
ncbi:glycosyltransferase family 4 protein [Salegentibacter sp. Hel_I_6]|uniref:glycosyltransferase family 4 protein n=1 Tax=Salegentibacter sp. Hel_I_6 TaxID=1250278 RepID=UPI00055C0355|nr:glycosyltransferase family 4 protein [Salegentibacter sp. Hel_I_6]